MIGRRRRRQRAAFGIWFEAQAPLVADVAADEVGEQAAEGREQGEQASDGREWREV